MEFGLIKAHPQTVYDIQKGIGGRKSLLSNSEKQFLIT